MNSVPKGATSVRSDSSVVSRCVCQQPCDTRNSPRRPRSRLSCTARGSSKLAAADAAAAPQRIVPDGRCELVVHLGDGFEESGIDGRRRIQPRFLLPGSFRARYGCTPRARAGPRSPVPAYGRAALPRHVPFRRDRSTARPAGPLADDRRSIHRRRAAPSRPASKPTTATIPRSPAASPGSSAKRGAWRSRISWMRAGRAGLRPRTPPARRSCAALAATTARRLPSRRLGARRASGSRARSRTRRTHARPRRG